MGHRRVRGITLALSLVALLAAWLVMLGAQRLAVELHMAVSTSETGQVFARSDTGYSERRATGFELVPDGSLRRYRLDLDADIVAPAIRIDPGTAPGDITIASVDIFAADRSYRIEGRRLSEEVRLLHDLRLVPGGGDRIVLRATGPDPHLEFALPPALAKARSQRRNLALALYVLGAAGLAFIVLGSGRASPRTLARLRRSTWLQALGTAVGVFAILAAVDAGCATTTCSSRGIGYGFGLFVAALCVGVVGAACLRLTRARTHTPRTELFLAVLVGQVALVVYLYVRSLLHAVIPALPVTRTELVVLVLIAGFYLARVRSHAPEAGAARARGWLMVRMAALAAVCIVVADRELPRLVLLSTDPDTHAFFARQIERFGGVYRSQGGWGDEPAGYPAGSGLLIFAWSRFSPLGITNTLAALPLLQSFIAALAIAEAVAAKGRRAWPRSLVLVTAVGVTGAAFLFPTFAGLAHMEGTGRQVSMALAAAFAILLGRVMASQGRDRMVWIAWLSMTLFVLAVLNPVNPIFPCILLAGAIAALMLQERRLSWLIVVPVACLLMLLLDPYYWAMATGQEPVVRLELEPGLARMSALEILQSAASSLRHHFASFVQQQLHLVQGNPFPAFGVIALGYWLASLPAAPPPAGRARMVGAMVVLILTIVFSALLMAAATDARLYLLSPYFQFSLAQYKALLLTAMCVGIVAMAAARGASMARLALVALACMTLPYLVVRPTQAMQLDPRFDDCGSVGCARASDIRVVERLESLVESGALTGDDGELPRILVPNMGARSGAEHWFFPTGGSRYLAMADALPVAFYYYQGDADYTTRNYRERVCSTLDRQWLAEQRIDYVFLPADREGVCLAEIDSLPRTDEVILSDGDTHVIKLRQAARP